MDRCDNCGRWEANDGDLFCPGCEDWFNWQQEDDMATQRGNCNCGGIFQIRTGKLVCGHCGRAAPVLPVAETVQAEARQGAHQHPPSGAEMADRVLSLHWKGWLEEVALIVFAFRDKVNPAKSDALKALDEIGAVVDKVFPEKVEVPA